MRGEERRQAQLGPCVGVCSKGGVSAHRGQRGLSWRTLTFAFHHEPPWIPATQVKAVLFPMGDPELGGPCPGRLIVRSGAVARLLAAQTEEEGGGPERWPSQKGAEDREVLKPSLWSRGAGERAHKGVGSTTRETARWPVLKGTGNPSVNGRSPSASFPPGA